MLTSTLCTGGHCYVWRALAIEGEQLFVLLSFVECRLSGHVLLRHWCSCLLLGSVLSNLWPTQSPKQVDEHKLGQAEKDLANGKRHKHFVFRLRVLVVPQRKEHVVDDKAGKVDGKRGKVQHNDSLVRQRSQCQTFFFRNVQLEHGPEHEQG